jgi:hypothetical protein
MVPDPGTSGFWIETSKSNDERSRTSGFVISR